MIWEYSCGCGSFMIVNMVGNECHIFGANLSNAIKVAVFYSTLSWIARRRHESTSWNSMRGSAKVGDVLVVAAGLNDWVVSGARRPFASASSVLDTHCKAFMRMWVG